MSAKKLKLTQDEENTVSGYLVDVKPNATSKNNNKYFSGTMQTAKTTFQHFVCFDISKSPSFQAANSQKSPVKLNNISLVPSQRGGCDIMIKRQSNLEVVKSLNFTFKESSDPKEETCCIEKITSMPAYQKDSGENSVTEEKTKTLLTENQPETIQYVIEQADGSSTTVIPAELANLLLTAQKSVHLSPESINSVVSEPEIINKAEMITSCCTEEDSNSKDLEADSVMTIILEPAPGNLEGPEVMDESIILSESCQDSIMESEEMTSVANLLSEQECDNAPQN